LYGVGSGKLPGNVGIVARYLLDSRNDTPPTVSLTTPTDNATRLAPANIWLRAAASDADGIISKVEFYNGTTLLHTEFVTPYGFRWRNVPLGTYTITAKAYDNSGLVTTSAPVHVSVIPNKPPIVSIIKPKNNEPFAAPAYIHFEADAKDVDGRITRVEIYNGSTLLNTQYQYPYTYVWRNLPVGTYTITAVATDNWGAHSTSAPVTFRVIPPKAIVSSKRSSDGNNLGITDAVSLALTPNPAMNVLNINARGLHQNKALTISVVSASGVLMKTMQSNTSTKTIQMDVSSFAKGIYTIKLISGNKVLYKQFVKL
jgi:predicted phage tail protein